MMNKTGQTGGEFIVNFVVTIMIIILLIGFVIISNIVKESSKHNAGETVFKEDSLGVEDGVGYMENYARLVEARIISRTELSLDEALSEVDYEE